MWAKEERRDGSSPAFLQVSCVHPYFTRASTHENVATDLGKLEAYFRIEVFTCSHVCMWAGEYIHVFAHVCRGQRSASLSSSITLQLIFLRQGVFMYLGFMDSSRLAGQ